MEGTAEAGEGEAKMTMGEKWLSEIQIIHYIVALPIATFPQGKGKNHCLYGGFKLTRYLRDGTLISPW